MSEQDRMDWNEDADFDSLADEPMEGFGDFDEFSDFEGGLDDDFMPEDSFGGPETPEMREPQQQDPEDQDETAAAPVRKKAKAKRYRGISAGELGLLFTSTTLVGAAGVGSAALLAVGVNPLSLWDKNALLNLDYYLNLQNHPLNVLYLVCLGIVALTLLGSRAIGKAAGGANKRTKVAEEMLDKLTALRLDQEEAWQDAAFKKHPQASAFTSEVLGAWRLQSARHKRFAGLEGELVRLEKALAENSRTDLTSRFDTPTVGSLADQMLRYFDERKAAAKELEEIRSRDEVDSRSIVNIIQDARSWNRATLDQIGVQGAALERLATRVGNLGDGVVRLGGDVGTWKQASEQVRLIAKDVEAQTAAASGNDVMAEFNDLVDRGSKLAFQIAMEVARLGTKGERLLPMTQSLEDLTTDFRQTVDAAATDRASGSGTEAWKTRLDKVAAALEAQASGETKHLLDQAKETGPSARQLATNLADIARDFNTQAERLVKLGENFARLTGAEFNPEDIKVGKPDNPPEGALNLEKSDPFAKEEERASDLMDVDPFVNPANRSDPADNRAPDPDFQRSITPEDPFASGDEDSTPSAPLEIESGFGSGFHETSGGSEENDPPRLQITDQVPESEPVYELGEFGSPVPLESTAPPAPPAVQEEPIYELDDLGGSPVVDEDQEMVYDLEDFGAKAPEEDEVQDLNAFGAVRIERASEETEEEIHDLADFGAVPLN